LLTVNVTDSVTSALELLNKYNISQIPVMDGKEFVGSLNESFLFTRLIENSELKNEQVKKVMQPPFPVVGEKAPIEEVSKLITRDNNAVLMRDLGGNVHIITKHDIIQAVAQMG
jgi:cystathionine beta-synthase